MNLTKTPILIAALGLLTAAASAQTRVQILHASDLEGGVDAVQDAPNFAAVVEALESDAANGTIPSLLLSAGDNYIPGPFFSAAGDFSLRNTFRTVLGQPDAREGEGRVDVSIMNLLGFDASAVGNHEFDAGTGAFGGIIGTDIRNNFTQARWLGAQFPYLSSNLDFSNSSLSGLYTGQILPSTEFQGTLADLVAAAAAPKLAAATTVTRGGETFGIVGATTPIVASISSTGGVTVNTPGAGTNDMVALATVLQPTIDALSNQGVDKIILVTHLQQFALEQQLVQLLSGVDVVIAGGSDTLLADASDRLRAGDVAEGNYPTVTTNGDGDPALLLSTDGQYSYVGRLVVDFDVNGVVVPSSVVAAESGVYATDDQGVIDLFGNLVDPFLAGTDAASVKALTDAVRGIVIARDANIVGRSDVFLEGRRTPIRTQQTNMGDLTADANLFAARQFDATVQVSHKNGGGIRNPIGSIGQNGKLGPNEANPLSGKQAGEVSQLDVENTLRFNNGLVLQTLSRAQFKEVLEHAVAGSAPGSTPGQFGQFSGVSFSFDVNLPAGSRVRYAALRDATAETIVVQDGDVVGNQPIRIVTLDFLQGGGDGYPFDTFAAADPVFADVVELETAGLPTGAATFAAAGTEQDAFAEYMLAKFSSKAFGTADLPARDDQRVQQIGTRPGFTVTQNQPNSRDFAVSNAAPFAFGFVAVGLRPGLTTFDLGLFGRFENGLETLLVLPVGLADASGDLTGTWPAPFNGTVQLIGQLQLLSFNNGGLGAATTESVAFDL